MSQVFYYASLIILKDSTMHNYCKTKIWNFNRGMLKNVRLLAEIEAYCYKIGAMGAYYHTVWSSIGLLDALAMHLVMFSHVGT